MTVSLALDPAADFAVHRGAMLRFARRKIRDEALAEDTVQDALLAQITAPAAAPAAAPVHAFSGRSFRLDD